MSIEHSVLCGGGPAHGLGRARPLRLDIYARNPPIRFRLEQVRAALWKDIPPVLRDLLDLAVYVYAADQAVERAGGGRVDGDEIGAGWRRTFRFRVPVRLPELWNSAGVQESLVSTLSFLSEDEYTFDFTPLGKERSLDGFIDFDTTPFDGVVDEVVMFSGGLDSLAGAVTEAVGEKRQVLLVNHRPTEKRSRRHAELLRRLAAHAGNRAPLHVPVRANKKKRLGNEFTQRTRSFLFAALGATFARMSGLDQLRFYENGVVSLNLPISAQVVGARASRTTHPRVLAGFERLLGAVLGRRFTVENRFLWDTKADVVRRIAGAGCGDLIGLTTSCGHVWARTKGRSHCGVCSQCIDRRFGVLAAGQGGNDPDGAYEVDLLTGQRAAGMPRTMLAGYLELVERVERMGEADFFDRFGELARVLPHVGLPPRVAATRVFELYRNHAREVTSVINQAIVENVNAVRRRELPRGCLIRLVYDDPSVGPEDRIELTRPDGNYFIKRGRFWAVKYGGGGEGNYPLERGFDYLRLLLAAPGTQFTAGELAARVHLQDSGMPPTARRSVESAIGGTLTAPTDGDDLLDDEYRDRLRARLPEIDEELEIARASGTVDGVERADELERQKQFIETELAKLRDRLGRTRKLGDARDRVRNRVCNAIRRALKHIASEDPPLAAHLKPPILNLGHSLGYVPRCDTTWTVDAVRVRGEKSGLHEK